MNNFSVEKILKQQQQQQQKTSINVNSSINNSSLDINNNNSNEPLLNGDFVNTIQNQYFNLLRNYYQKMVENQLVNNNTNKSFPSPFMLTDERDNKKWPPFHFDPKVNNNDQQQQQRLAFESILSKYPNKLSMDLNSNFQNYTEQFCFNKNENGNKIKNQKTSSSCNNVNGKLKNNTIVRNIKII
jgi:hypothetical protein